jgi:hypothetical protein
VRSHDEYTTFKSWLIYLLNDIDEISPIVNLSEGLITTINSAERDIMEAVFQGVIRRISNNMASAIPLAGFGCCLEDIPTFKFISAALSIFGKAQTVCVFTAGDYEEWQREVIQPFKKKIGSKTESIVELSPLIGEQVEILVHERWRSASEHENPHNIEQHASPFDLEGIKDAFGLKPRPIGKILSIVAKLLELKAPTYENGPPWPEAEHLRFSAEELRENVRILEES